MPRVTVVIATYNWATVLPYSIGSVLDQTFTDFELLVIGDGCTDESGDVVSSFNDSRVHWRNLPGNVGHQYAPNNEGIRRGNGDVIAYLGHDDLWLPRHLDRLVACIDDGARIVYGTWLVVSPAAAPGRPASGSWVYRPGVWIPPTALVHDRELAVSVGGWRAPTETGVLDPESDLVQRMVAVADDPRWMERITCVKFPAALRANVYRERPHHEQATWLQEIRSLDDPEEVFERRYPAQTGRPRSKTHLVMKRVRSKFALRSRLRKVGLLAPEPPPETAEERRLRRRAFKGLGD